MKRLRLCETGNILGSRVTGECVRSQVDIWLRAGEQVILDFEGVEMATPSFVDELVGKLFRTWGPQTLRGRLRIVNASPQTRALIRRMVDARVQEWQRRETRVANAPA